MARPPRRPSKPQLVVGDGTLGFWQALHAVWPTARQQRCWAHKTATVLNALIKSVQGEAKKRPPRHRRSPKPRRRRGRARPLRRWIGHKVRQAATCPKKDRSALLACYDFPAEHWKHLRTGNPIDSTFATVRPRTEETEGCLSRETALAPGASPDAPCCAAGLLRCCSAMVFKFARSAETSWRRLDGATCLGQLIAGIRFRDGEAATNRGEQAPD